MEGLRELRAASKKAEGDLKNFRGRMKWIAEPVAEDAVSRGSRFAGIGPIKPRLHGARGVDVEQTKGKVTGKRGDFGALQMRTVLEPALDARQGEVVDRFETVVDEITRRAGF